MVTVPKGKRIITSGKTYRAGEELPEKHAKLLSITAPKQAANKDTKK